VKEPGPATKRPTYHSAFLELDDAGMNEPGKLELLDLNDEYWAMTLENPELLT
jgi:hypothetical protein